MSLPLLPMQSTKQRVRSALPKIYSQDLINNLFRHPYTKIDLLMAELQVSRPTATRYLTEMAQLGVLDKQKIGRESYYFNRGLIELLLNASQSATKALA
jgi:Fic family protein